MTDANDASSRQIFTIGHSNHTWEAFLGLLRENGITVVVDVRSSPYSRYTPHFNKEPLSQALPPAGVSYLFLGDRLGGHPAATDLYDLDGRVLYDRLADSAAFQEGLSQLYQTIKGHRTTLLCGEEDPSHCHRRLLIARVLSRSGMMFGICAAMGGCRPRRNWRPQKQCPGRSIVNWAFLIPRICAHGNLYNRFHQKKRRSIL